MAENLVIVSFFILLDYFSFSYSQKLSWLKTAEINHIWNKFSPMYFPQLSISACAPYSHKYEMFSKLEFVFFWNIFV